VARQNTNAQETLLGSENEKEKKQSKREREKGTEREGARGRERERKRERGRERERERKRERQKVSRICKDVRAYIIICALMRARAHTRTHTICFASRRTPAHILCTHTRRHLLQHIAMHCNTMHYTATQA